MGALVVASFCLVVAGPNLPTALLPAYRAAYRMTPFGLSLIFSAYLVLLVPALILCTRPALRARAGLLLSVGLALAVVADLVMVTSHSPQMLVVGRALSGVSVALSTGAAAALMVALVGERGRGSVATGNIAGALLGTVSAVLLAQVGAGPSVYLLHGAAVLVVLAMLLPALSARRAAHKLAPNTASIEPELADAPDPKTPAPTSSPAVIRRHAVLALAVGAVGWAIPGLVTGLVPALLRDFTGPTAVIVATSPAILLLGSAWGLQVLAKRPIMRRIRGYELTVGITMGAVGLTLLTVGALARSISLVYLGCAVAAGGPALGYRGGMVLLTRGLDPAAQGAATSRYAATSYGVSACVVLGAGAIGTLGGMVTAVTMGAGLLALVAFALLATILTTERPSRPVVDATGRTAG
jgi:MFS family permease